MILRNHRSAHSVILTHVLHMFICDRRLAKCEWRSLVKEAAFFLNQLAFVLLPDGMSHDDDRRSLQIDRTYK